MGKILALLRYHVQDQEVAWDAFIPVLKCAAVHVM